VPPIAAPRDPSGRVAPRLAATIALTIAACGVVPGVPRQGVVPAGPVGGVAGFVTEAGGQPVSGAVVVASCQVSDFATTTDAQGWYDLGPAALRPGPCTLKGSTPDGRGFFEDVVVVAGATQRVDIVARRP